MVKIIKEGTKIDMKATRQSYGEALVELGKENEKIVVLDADLANATKTIEFAKEFPQRFFDIGIAEADMIGTAAGMSLCGKIPYASTFAVFAAGRTYDQIRSSVCYPNLNVKICATHAGVTVGEDGATHQMLEDISLMRVLPNMKVFCPSDDVQTKWIIKEISKIQGPCYVRLCRLATPDIYDENQKFEIGKMVQIGEGTDATIFATGVVVTEALKAQKMLQEKGIDNVQNSSKLEKMISNFFNTPFEKRFKGLIHHCSKSLFTMVQTHESDQTFSAVSIISIIVYICKMIPISSIGAPIPDIKDSVKK